MNQPIRLSECGLKDLTSQGERGNLERFTTRRLILLDRVQGLSHGASHGTGSAAAPFFVAAPAPALASGDEWRRRNGAAMLREIPSTLGGYPVSIEETNRGISRTRPVTHAVTD